MIRKKFLIVCLVSLLANPTGSVYCQVLKETDPLTGSVRIKDNTGNLVINIGLGNRCVIDSVITMKRTVVKGSPGVFSSIKVDGEWFSTSSGIPSPGLTRQGDRVTIDNIVFGRKDRLLNERWIFQPGSGFIDWTIERTYPGGMTLEDTGFPEWSFDGLETWTGALLGTGGVAWCRLFDRQNASLGNHTGEVTFWNQSSNACLRIMPVETNGFNTAVRFSRQPDNRFTLNYTVSEEKMRSRHFLSRFIADHQDIWDEFDARGKVSITYRLTALDFDKAYSRGEFPGIDGESVRNILNTIARVGVIDENLMGSNSWHIDMGYVCLHEQWIARMGIAIDDPAYTSNYRKALDYYRDNAISSEGNVKDRWGYRIWDSRPATFDNGFYECQWGDLLDSNTDYVINVAALFSINGDQYWVKTHKKECEKVLGFLLARDSDNDGLIEAYTDSYKEKKGSDWIDVIWASYENAFINAKLFEALKQWSEVEKIIGDPGKADYYAEMAEKCRKRFNQPVNAGGFWSPENNWYVYWRDKDDSIHGDNLVTPVNFMAIAYGICIDSIRKSAILSRIEKLMKDENLFIWPISFFPYKKDEGSPVNYPFPNYENGDIFLAWAEVGIRAYQDYDPSIPVKYIRNVLRQYEKDGLAFQRYDRIKQEGQGNDILANNCLAVVGLYQDIYGIRPEYNRLVIDPHMTAELNGTKLQYRLRDLDYTIGLSENNYSVTAGLFTISSGKTFGIDLKGDTLLYFPGNSSSPSMQMSSDHKTNTYINIEGWDDNGTGPGKWSVRNGSDRTVNRFDLYSLKANSSYIVLKNGNILTTCKSDEKGMLHFSCSPGTEAETTFEVRYH